MADVGLWIKSANIQARCPSSCSATSMASAATDVYVWDVENYINVLCKNKITAAVYAALGTDIKYLLMDIGASICAMYVINADMSGFASLREAETSLDFLNERINRGVDIIKDMDKKLFMGLS